MANRNTQKDLQTEEWVKRANDDELSLEAILKERGAPNTACFLSQQMGEKYLKAFLVHKKKWYPKVHALDALWELCNKIDSSFEELKNDAVFLNDFYVTTRYPGDYPSFSMKDAREAYQAALRVKNFVLGKIGKPAS